MGRISRNGYQSSHVIHELNAKTIVSLTVETYAVRILSLGASFVSNILLARLLGPEGKGYIATVLFWSSLVSSILVFGLDSTAVYFVGKSPGRFHKLARLFLVYVIVATLLGAVVLQVVDRLAGLFRGQYALTWFAAGLILMMLLAALYNTLYIGVGQLSFTNWVSVIGTVLSLLSLSGLYWMGLADVTLILLAMLVVQALIDLWLVIRALLLPRLGAADPIRWLDFGKYASKVYLGNLAGFLYFRGNFMILSLSAPIGEVGIYSIAQIFADVILILPTTLINIIFPKVAGMSKEAAIQRVSETTRITVVVTLAMALGIASVGMLLIPLIFGRAFQAAAGMVWILCLGAWVTASGMILSIYFNGANKPQVPSAAAWIGFAVVTLLTFVLAPQWGGYGAAVALSLSRLLVAGYMLILYLRDSRERLAAVILAGPDDWRRGFDLIRSVWS